MEGTLKYRYFIQIGYAGTRYCGWQAQKNGISVQQVLDGKLSLKLREKIVTTGSGRTDTGVHAASFVAHFDTTGEIPDGTEKQLNAFLPDDISVKKIYRVKNDAHARFSALERTYEYRISQVKDPFRSEFTYFLKTGLNIAEMNSAAGILLKTSDFTSFCKLHSGNKTNICRVTNAVWEEKNGLIIFTITADRFLRNMVRSIVGTMIEIGKGRYGIEKFISIIDSKDRKNAASSAPAKGLFLMNVVYPDDILI